MHDHRTVCGKITDKHASDSERHGQQSGDLRDRPRLHTKLDDRPPLGGLLPTPSRVAAGGDERLKREIMAGPRSPPGVRIRPNYG